MVTSGRHLSMIYEERLLPTNGNSKTAIKNKEEIPDRRLSILGPVPSLTHGRPSVKPCHISYQSLLVKETGRKLEVPLMSQ